MRARLFGVEAIDRNGAFNAPSLHRDQETVPLRIISLKELRQFGCDLCLEEKAEAPVLVLVGTVKLGHPPDRARDVALDDLDIRHRTSPLG
jgi:hypothetical protein